MFAADDERMTLADELDRGAGASLQELRALVDRIPTGSDPAISAAVEQSRNRLAGLDAGLRSLSSGLGPPTLKSDGLAAALLQLGGDANVDVRVDVATGDLPDHVASAIYFICAEAISNALKHASASSISVHLRAADERRVPGDRRRRARWCGPEGGSGLQGLVDRTAALGWEPGDRKPTRRRDEDHRRPPDTVAGGDRWRGGIGRAELGSVSDPGVGHAPVRLVDLLVVRGVVRRQGFDLRPAKDVAVALDTRRGCRPCSQMSSGASRVRPSIVNSPEQDPSATPFTHASVNAPCDIVNVCTPDSSRA